MSKKLKFSRWISWKERLSLEGLRYPGVYTLLYYKHSVSGESFSWRDNIIYIGMTNQAAGLKGRLGQFDNTIAGKKGHGGADRVRYKYENYSNLIKNLYVSVSFVECDVKLERPEDLIKMGEVARLEYICFAEFVKRFKRLPEFNNKKLSPKYSLMKAKG